MECNTLQYSFHHVSSPFYPEELCPNYDNIRQLSPLKFKEPFMMEPFYKNISPPPFVRSMMKVKYNFSETAVENCKRNLQYRAEIIFRMATDSMPVTVMSRRLSFFDKMSAFGKHQISVKQLKL